MTTFTRRTRTFDEATGRSTETTTTIEGLAIQVRGSRTAYARLGLTEEQAITLLFTPDEYNLLANTDEFVRPGDEVNWTGDATSVVRGFDDITAPDGYVIVSKIVVERP